MEEASSSPIARGSDRGARAKKLYAEVNKLLSYCSNYIKLLKILRLIHIQFRFQSNKNVEESYYRIAKMVLLFTGMFEYLEEVLKTIAPVWTFQP